MELQRIKLTIAVMWMLAAAGIAAAIDLSWTSGITLALLGVLPPLAIIRLWRDPAQTLSESISEARR